MTAPNKKEIVSLIKQTTRTDIFPSENSSRINPVSKAVGPPGQPSFSGNRELNSVIVFVYSDVIFGSTTITIGNQRTCQLQVDAFFP